MDNQGYCHAMDDGRMHMEMDAVRVNPCMQKATGATSIVASDERSDSPNPGSCGKVNRQHMDHIAEPRHVGSFHHCLAHKQISVQEAMKMPEFRAAVNFFWKLTTIKLKSQTKKGEQQFLSRI